MNVGRTFNSFRNFSFTLIEQFLYNIISFICRTVFIYILGKTYLGFNGLFNDILSLLSLAEFGIGTAITYYMYKPTAEGNLKKVSAYLNYYKKLYISIGIIIGFMGLLLTPFLKFLIFGIEDKMDIEIIYLLYLFNTTVSYFFSYKRSILITQQKNYILSIIYIITILAQNIFQILSLLIFRNFILYLIIQIIFTFLNNLIVSIYVDRKNSYLLKYKNEKLSIDDRKELITNVKAMFTNKISSAIVTSTDNLLISRFVSTIILGLYSNYTLFVNMLKTIITKIFESIVGSIGNLVSTEATEKSKEVFLNLLFGNFWVVSFCCILLFTFINAFINLWIGKEYILNIYIVILICINLYMRLMRNSLLSFLETYGLFKELKLKSILESIINLFTSLYFVICLKMGIFGVLLGTFLSNLSTNFWLEPYILYKNKFNRGLINYFRSVILYLLITLIIGGISYYINNILLCSFSLVYFLIKLIFTTIIINLVYIFIFHKNKCYIFYRDKIKKLKIR